MRSNHNIMMISILYYKIDRYKKKFNIVYSTFAETIIIVIETVWTIWIVDEEN